MASCPLPMHVMRLCWEIEPPHSTPVFRLHSDVQNQSSRVGFAAQTGLNLNSPQDAKKRPANEMEDGILPVVDLSPCLDSGTFPPEMCDAIAQSFLKTGCLIIHDPRVSESDNFRFIDMMQRYFSQSSDEKKSEERPELYYQVGVTPGGVEIPRCLKDPKILSQINNTDVENRPTLPSGPDPKWRYFWRVGPRVSDTQYAELNSEPVVPKNGFPGWSEMMDGWGGQLLSALQTVSEGLAIGLGLDQRAFVDSMKNGPHLLGPTGFDLGQYGQEGLCFAGYHYDLNFLTIHGKAPFPGLYVWFRNGKRVPVVVPKGCLLIQAGKQLEWLTGGAIMAGMHEGVCSKETMRKVECARQEGKSLWRVSSTLFGHIASDEVLVPLGKFKNASSLEKYPPTAAGAYVRQELAVIELKAT